jgi:outer membrane protein OmpA-like peptidoglycan-associated protein
VKQPKEGFWGHVNPFARKKWVKARLDPINDQLSELDEVNGKNAKDIRDVDDRAQTGIHRAQGTADAANQTATAAGEQARHAGSTAQNAMGHVDNLTTTVNGLDTYGEKSNVDIAFRGGQPILSTEARKRLDDLATQMNGQSGYILELEAHSPASGSAGIESSGRLAEAVKRYMVTEHNIPVYRMHAVALGNAHGNGEEDEAKPVRSSSVHIRLMENSLAAQGAAPTQGAGASSGTAQP